MRPPEAAKFYFVQLLSNQAMWAAWLFLPNLAKLLGSSDSMIGVIGASFGFAVFVSSYIFGRRTDIEGSKRYLHLGLLFSSLAVALVFLTQDALSLVFFYFLAGLAIGMYPATLIAYVFGKKLDWESSRPLVRLGLELGGLRLV